MAKKTLSKKFGSDQSKLLKSAGKDFSDVIKLAKKDLKIAKSGK